KLGDGLPRAKLLSAPGGEPELHVWLGLSPAEAMVDEIRDKLKEVDREHAADYDANAGAYVDVLRKDGRDYWADLRKDNKKKPAGVGAAESLRYFAAEFVPEADVAPTPEKCAELAKRPGHVVALRPAYPTEAAKAFEEELRKRGLKDAEFVEIDPL